MLRSEIDTVELEMKLAKTPERALQWIEERGEDVLIALREEEARESEEVDALNRENTELEKQVEEAESAKEEAETTLEAIMDALEEDNLETAKEEATRIYKRYQNGR